MQALFGLLPHKGKAEEAGAYSVPTMSKRV
jgi:hypothetical protein